MAHIRILDETGYISSHIASEDARLGHQIVSYSNHPATRKADGITYLVDDHRNDTFIPTACNDADFVISALPAQPLASEAGFRVLLCKATGHYRIVLRFASRENSIPLPTFPRQIKRKYAI